jgi:acyl-CoA thioester hydrolase
MNSEISTDRNTYRYITPINLRYGDTDKLGHINNAVYATLLESGRAALLFDRRGAIAGAGRTFVIANLNIDFLAEMHYPGTAEVGTAIGRFGRSSLTLVQAIFKDGVCCATSQSTIVLIDEKTRRSSPIDAGLKDVICRAAGLVAADEQH